MLEEIRQTARHILEGEPGRRFITHYQENRGREKNRAKVLVLGVLLTIAGIIVSLPPVLSGFFLWVPGLALIASQARFMALFLDACERTGRAALARLKSWFSLKRE